MQTIERTLSHKTCGQRNGEFTCGKDDVPGNQFVVDYGELRELDACHPSHSSLSSFPVELDVICCVTICTGNREGVIHVREMNREAQLPEFVLELELIIYFYLPKWNRGAQ